MMHAGKNILYFYVERKVYIEISIFFLIIHASKDLFLLNSYRCYSQWYIKGRFQVASTEAQHHIKTKLCVIAICHFKSATCQLCSNSREILWTSHRDVYQRCNTQILTFNVDFLVSWDWPPS